MLRRNTSLSFLERRVPNNPKFNSITPLVDTGCTMRKASKTLSEQEMSRRRSELFRRVRNSRIADLLRQADLVDIQESIYSYSVEQDGVYRSRSVNAPSVVSLGGKSAGHVSLVSSEALGVANTRSFLIVDLRSPEDYSHGRILHSVSHPGDRLVRDLVHPAMMAFKRKRKGHFLLLYHADHKRSAYYATLLVEKGWEEVFIVEGGFDEFSTSYPELIEQDPSTGSGSLLNTTLLNKTN